MGEILGLRCRDCGITTPEGPRAVCAECWGALEPTYNLDRARTDLRPEALASRPNDVRRFHELLPIEPDSVLGAGVGGTPLYPAPRLGARLGIPDLWIKDEGACQPSLAFKDRLVAIALEKGRAFGLDVFACASTGNLGASLAALCARAGVPSVAFVPETTAPSTLRSIALYGGTVVAIRGDYDRANRLASEVAERFGWGLVNINLKSYYAEGAKTIAFEIVEQLGWRVPAHVLVPMGGGSLLVKFEQAFEQLAAIGWITPGGYTLHGVQPQGCAPIVNAWRDRLPEPRPVRAQTRVHSLAVGDPGEGIAALLTLNRTGGSADDPSDAACFEGVSWLAETEGLLVDPAGGAVIAAARRLANEGLFQTGGPVVLVMTAHGARNLSEEGPSWSTLIDGRLDEFEAYWSQRATAASSSS